MPIDQAKCRALKAELLSMPPLDAVVSIGRFFDGNDDPASIGCNLSEHSGIDAFRTTLLALKSRRDVEAVYARIAEIDPGEDCWPFTDTIFIAGTISLHELREHLRPLQPDEIEPGEQFDIPSSIGQKHRSPVLAAWWD